MGDRLILYSALMDFQTRPLSENFGAEVLNVDLTQIDEDMAEAILSAVQKHALLLFCRQSLHDDDIYRLSRALGPVEEPPAAKDNHSPGFKSVIKIRCQNPVALAGGCRHRPIELDQTFA